MATAMSELQATAAAHLSRDLATGRRWVCGCEACARMRPLVGLEKALRVRPLVRAIGEMETRLTRQPAGPDQRALSEQYLGLYDQLAGVMAD